MRSPHAVSAMKWGIMAQRSNRRRRTDQLITPDPTPSAGVDYVLVSGAVSLPVSPERLWDVVSQPQEIASWLSELHAWTGPAADRVDAGDELAAQIQLFHMLHDVRLVVTEYHPARSWTMTCSAVAGIAVTFTVELEYLREVSRATLRTGLHGTALRDADAVVLRHAIQSELDSNLRQLAEIANPEGITTLLPAAVGHHSTRDDAAGFE
ncbi:SRPBCC family protein [Nocardia sp. NPDC058519]|uniref:SRPBCC family protein n=1 Tax=Nocardia sp. NPDC058519 TaxID=3346535 RepID=UPI0036500704